MTFEERLNNLEDAVVNMSGLLSQISNYLVIAKLNKKIELPLSKEEFDNVINERFTFKKNGGDCK